MSIIINSNTLLNTSAITYPYTTSVIIPITASLGYEIISYPGGGTPPQAYITTDLNFITASFIQLGTSFVGLHTTGILERSVVIGRMEQSGSLTKFYYNSVYPEYYQSAGGTSTTIVINDSNNAIYNYYFGQGRTLELLNTLFAYFSRGPVTATDLGATTRLSWSSPITGNAGWWQYPPIQSDTFSADKITYINLFSVPIKIPL